MPLPDVSEVHINQLLTNVSVAYFQNMGRLVYNKVFPIVPVTKKTDTYPVWTRADFNRVQAKKRAVGTVSAHGEFGLTYATYQAEVTALHSDIPWEVSANTDEALAYEEKKAMFTAMQVALKAEVDFGTAYWQTGIWGTDLTGVAAAPGAGQFLQFDAATADIPDFFDEQKETVLEATGFEPNILVLGSATARGIKNNADIKDRIKYTQRGIVTEEMLAGLLGFDRVLVAKSIRNTAAQGATEASSFVFDKKSALMVYANPMPSKDMPSAGYSFTWTTYLNGSQEMATTRYYSADRKVWVVENEMAYDQKVVGADLGVFMESCVA